MLAIRREGNEDERALVPAMVAVEPYSPPRNLFGEEAVDEEDPHQYFNEGARRSYREIFGQRKKCMLTIAASGSALLIGLFTVIICLSVKASTAPVIDPTTPAPLISTTTGVTTTPMTSTSTSTSTTTSTTTTTTTTTTEKPSTTTHPTTTTPQPRPGPPEAPTVRPIPSDAIELPPSTLIQQVFYPSQINYTEVTCRLNNPPTYKYILRVAGVSESFPGESGSKVHAKTAASKLGAEKMFGLDYGKHQPVPPAPQPCGDTEEQEGDQTKEPTEL